MAYNAKSLTNPVVAEMTDLRGATERVESETVEITETLQTNPRGEFVRQRQVAKNAEPTQYRLGNPNGKAREERKIKDDHRVTATCL